MPRKIDPLELILKKSSPSASTGKNGVKIIGPMVRYSKLPFRATCRQYNVDMVYTPMILAREFVRNEHARFVDFATNKEDSPLIVQVGCNNSTDLLRFVELVKDYCDGIGINCGCPIREQVNEGIGSALIYNPELLCEMVSNVKNKYGNSVRLETKIRIHENWDSTVDLCRKLCSAGVDWITIHGRTRYTRTRTPSNLDAIKYIRERVPMSLPIIANGDCFSSTDFDRIMKYTNVQGVMAVRGALRNPAIFTGVNKCPWSCIEWFWYYAMEYGLHYALLQHHLFCMLENSGLDKDLLKELMDCRSSFELLDWFDDKFVLKRNGEVGFGEGVEIPYK
ncbi:probable tRNA-dihydrouridine(20a/20b) synthase [NAD(P)+] [Saccharomycodes ludwigii]|uniref:tRNA-dihydrouridine synthase n=1 Tax=Saccharomycodes ludwigii TaxID=36035 RepID=A0A376B4F9_9ASCO|nr:hypothetical protein SCDLUD_004276 [Saccharomycodes ludwigii]KAH3899960.1 hypothetical protein SCDLUD_004276 [Saccharomycodes ludwigii]SSD59575.1 probable tRNA-dihydrouridine(20a/20b) synthase [NAD(P)+] [Saccharomycodes ludwigii]